MAFKDKFLTPEQRNNILQELSDLHDKLQKAEENVYLGIGKHSVKLQERVTFVHNAVENYLEYIIVSQILLPLEKLPLDIMISITDAKHDIQWEISEVVSNMDFIRKINLASSKGILDEKTKKLFLKVNNLRVAFSHKTAHEEKLEQLVDPEEEIKALKVLSETIELVSDFWNRRLRAK